MNENDAKRTRERAQKENLGFQIVAGEVIFINLRDKVNNAKEADFEIIEDDKDC